MLPTILMLVMAGSAPPASTLRVSLEVHDAGRGTPAVTGTIVAKPVTAPDAEEPSPVSSTFAGSGETLLSVPAGLAWEVRADAPAWWSQPVTTWAGGGATPVRLELWPASTVKGSIQVPKGEELPAEVTLWFSRAARVKVAPDGTITQPTAFEQPSGEAVCPLRQRRFECTVAAGELDLKLRAPRYVSRFWWARKLPAGGTIDLSPVRLQPGASLIGTITTVDGPADPAHCEVMLSPLEAGQPLSEAAKGPARTVHARINDRGFFSFDGVAPGMYSLEAMQPGFSTATVAPVDVRERTETSVRAPLILERPVALQVQVDPPADAYQRPWTLELNRVDERTSTWDKRFDGQFAADGWLEAADLPTGHYHAVLRDSAGAGFLDREVELTTTSPPLLLEPGMVTLDGRVLLGEKPLAADLWFGGRHALVSIPMTSDEDGAFRGTLPRQGEWRVEVSAEEPVVRRTLRHVDVRLSPSLGKAEVELRLPDTTLSGTVVDESGAAVARAEVMAIELGAGGGGQLNRLASDDAGGFVFDGLAPGQVSLEARDQAPEGPRSSGAVTVALDEGRTPPPVRLVLSSSHEVEVLVLGEGGEPVPGAEVYLLPDLGQGFVSATPQGMTDAAGTARIPIPSGGQRFYPMVFALGYALRAFATPLDPERPATLSLERFGGTLDLTLAEPVVWNEPAGRWLMSWQDGVPMSPALFLLWAQLNGTHVDWRGTRFRVPNLGAGRWVVCSLPLAQLLPGGAGSRSSEARCADGFLPPYGELELSLGGGG